MNMKTKKPNVQENGLIPIYLRIPRATYRKLAAKIKTNYGTNVCFGTALRLLLADLVEETK